MILSTGMSLSTEHEAAAAPCGASHLEEMLPTMAFFFFSSSFLCVTYCFAGGIP